jgi:hypothetical protein
MKKIIAIFTFVSLFAGFGISEARISRYPRGFHDGLSVRGVNILNSHSGNVFWVDSGSGSNGNSGKDFLRPFADVDYAVGRCTANNGDIIFVMAGHTEALDGADGVDVDVAGVAIIGLGQGVDSPEFTYDATADEFVIGAANVVINNLRFVAGISAITMGISVEAGGDNVTISDCVFPEPATSTFEFLDAIDLASGADSVTIIGNTYYNADATGAAHFIEAGNGVNNDLKIVDNLIHGEFSVSAIWSDTADLETLIKDNIITNMTTGQHCIEFTAAATGMCIGNKMFTDGATTTLDPGSMKCFDNDVVTAVDTSGTLVPVPGDSASNFIGVDDNNNVAATTNVVSNPDGSVLERQEYIQKLSEVLTAAQLQSIAGSSQPLAVWYVDANIGASGAGTSPATAFKTIPEAITASDNAVDDWILIMDYSGGGSTISINKAFVHLIGNANIAMPYPRIKPASAVDGIEITAAGDRVEIANLVIGAGDQTKAAIAIDTAAGGGAYGVYIHDCVIGRDADAPALLGISVPTGGAAPYLVVENNRFYGSAGAGIAAAGSALKLVGNATRCRISGNYISDIGRTATPAIWLSGSVTEPQIENNRIKTDTDTGTGSAITLSANVDDGWIAGNWAGDGKDAPANNPFVDGASTNGWSENYSGIVAVLP